jgi:hypothetical protein
MAGISPEVTMAAVYAVFLGLVAWTLEKLARQSQQRAEQFHRSGFRYHHDLGLWECPTGNRLHRRETDHHRRIVRYRAAAETCNACPVKAHCTDSPDGREIEQRVDSWVTSELRHFHHGLSLALLTLAALILVVEATRHYEAKEILLLACLLTPTVKAGAGRLLVLRKAHGNSEESDRSHI